MPALNFTVFLDKVENGTKCQSIRRATPYNLQLFQVGKPIKLYAGMGRRDYCKTPGTIVIDGPCPYLAPVSKRCNYSGECTSQGAKLLNEGTITEVFTIKLKELTPEIAVADGFSIDEKLKEIFTEEGIRGRFALDALKRFLIKTYNARKPDTEFLVIRWKPKED
jgi:hypothetical protein